MAAQREREAEELVAEWSSDLEAVLYQPEVEEAIREVSLPYAPPRLATFVYFIPPPPLSLSPLAPSGCRYAPPPTPSTVKTLTP